MGTPWQPSAEGLQQLLGLFRSSQSATNQQHRQIQTQLTQFNAIPDYNNYLVYILNQLKEEEGPVRQMAGLQLKNNVKQHWHTLSPEVQEYVRQNLLGSLGDKSGYIRATVGTCITTVIYSGGLEAWEQLLPTLYQMLDSPEMEMVDGAFAALYKVCEDSPEKLAQDTKSRALDFLIPKFLQFFSHAMPKFRRFGVGCINHFVMLMPPCLRAVLDQYVQGLFALATDTDPDVRKCVCQALVMLLDASIDKLEPHMGSVVQYMLQATTDSDENVALEACEFWSAICETQMASAALGGVLPQLVPVLLNGMVYSEEDILIYDNDDDDDEHVADRPEDVKPRFHKSRVMGGGGGDGAGGAGGGGAAEGGAGAVAGGGGGEEEEEEEDDDEDDDEDEDWDDDDDVSEWNLRKCSASGLDVLAGTFHDAVLPTLLPMLQERLASPQWEVRESGILALGAIAEGCMHAIAPYLPQLVPWLVQTLSDPKALVRSITCWTLSRYSKWVVQQPDQTTYLQPMMQEILKRVLDHNKKVQEAACSAFATLEEDAEAILVPYLGPILQNLVFALQKYQAKNLLILYDAIGTLADSVGSALSHPDHVNVLMPPLIAKWNGVADDDKSLLPLLECFTSISQALGQGFAAFVGPVYTRCVGLIERTLAAEQRAAQYGEEPPDKEFLVCALDLISGVTEGMADQVAPVIGAHAPSLLKALLVCMSDSSPDVRQSAYALVGDLAKASIEVLRPGLSEFLPVLTEHLNPDFVSVCNNAAWAIGEIAIKVGADLRHYCSVEAILQRLIPIINRHESINKSLLENTAITLGRLGVVSPELAAPLLETFIKPWCLALRSIRDDIEKEHAFMGLTAMIRLNPRAPLNCFVELCDAFCSWGTPPAELHQTFSQLLHGYKGSIPPEQWQAFMAGIPEDLRARLTERYAL
jgi:transportin-1